MKLKGALIASTVAGLFSLMSPLAFAGDKDGEEIICDGINACKGQGTCAGPGHACGGQNACKGQGHTKTTKKECLAKGGKVVVTKDEKKPADKKKS
jgi:hypothetical protein